jgi:hypothetical protein
LQSKVVYASAPQKLVDSDSKEEGRTKIWSDRPVFLWNIPGRTVQRIERFVQGVLRMAVVCTICHKATTVSSDGGSKARSHYRGVDSTGGATIALEKADYFAKEGLWSDALQELYSVSKSSAELTRAIAQIQAHDFYAQDSAS